MAPFSPCPAPVSAPIPAPTPYASPGSPPPRCTQDPPPTPTPAPPTRPPVPARDLARFLELLFDRGEREEAGGEERHGEKDGAPDHTPDPMWLDSLLKRFGIDE